MNPDYLELCKRRKENEGAQLQGVVCNGRTGLPVPLLGENYGTYRLDFDIHNFACSFLWCVLHRTVRVKQQPSSSIAVGCLRGRRLLTTFLQRRKHENRGKKSAI
jgi:hypothetical protein